MLCNHRVESGFGVDVRAKFILIDGADFLISANQNTKNQALKNAKISAQNTTKKANFEFKIQAQI